MKNRILPAIIFIFPVTLFIYFWWQPEAVKKTPPPAPLQISSTTASNAATAAKSVVGNRAALQPPAEKLASGVAADSAAAPAALLFTNFPPATVLQNMHRVFHQYGTMFGGNPVGNNSEITAALTGQNPKQINFISSEAGLLVNAAGELVDPWGTPYFFHQLSGAVMEIHSAGPDRILWTSDDLISK